MRAVRMERLGGPEVLEVVDVPDPVAAPGRVVVRVRAAAINPGEIAIREGRLEAVWPSALPQGEGSDLAGIVEQVGEGVEQLAAGDAVCGWSDERGSHAELASVPAGQLVAKPATVPWEVAGSMFVAPFAAYASIDAVAPRAGETVVIAGAAGGVGSVAVQLAARTGATVIALAGFSNHAWLRTHGAIPLVYADDWAEHVRALAPGGVDALADLHGGGYADAAIALGVAPSRINTIADREAGGRLGISMQGSSQIASRDVLAELVGLVAAGELEIPIAATYPLERVRDAYTELARGHTHGKIVLTPSDG
jgi:NADPH:quinone reductase-like Zn-dependent oxidoreductase